MKKIVVLGSTGMLGSTMTKFFKSLGLDTIEVNRSGTAICKNNLSIKLNVENDYDLNSILPHQDIAIVVNCVGLIRQLINPSDDSDIRKAFRINSEFPTNLNNWSMSTGVPIIQIGTDCVYSGNSGKYDELSEFDPRDVYGLTKLQGELNSPQAMTIRTSIVGLETVSTNSLMSWFLSRPLNSSVQGYANHYWNGVTTLSFAKVVAGVIVNGTFQPGIQHLVPLDLVSKFQLLQYCAIAFDRLDVEIISNSEAGFVDRTLTTVQPTRNKNLWHDAGYNKTPTIREMIEEYAQWEKSQELSQ